jgi:hypothetical protein
MKQLKLQRLHIREATVTYVVRDSDYPDSSWFSLVHYGECEENLKLGPLFLLYAIEFIIQYDPIF